MTLPWTTWVAWLVIAVAAAAVTAGICRSIHLRRAPAFAVALFAGVTALAALAALRASVQPRPAAVSIVSPRAGQLVKGPRLRVAGIVRPQDAVVAVLVRSESDRHWWVQPLVRAVPAGGGVGRWAVNAYVGTEREGRRENFQLLAVASADARAVNLLAGRQLRRGDRLRMVPLWPASEPVVVRRVE